jgi:hypothetical protein
LASKIQRCTMNRISAFCSTPIRGSSKKHPGLPRVRGASRPSRAERHDPCRAPTPAHAVVTTHNFAAGPRPSRNPQALGTWSCARARRARRRGAEGRRASRARKRAARAAAGEGQSAAVRQSAQGEAPRSRGPEREPSATVLQAVRRGAFSAPSRDPIRHSERVVGDPAQSRSMPPDVPSLSASITGSHVGGVGRRHLERHVDRTGTAVSIPLGTPSLFASTRRARRRRSRHRSRRRNAHAVAIGVDEFAVPSAHAFATTHNFAAGPRPPRNLQALGTWSCARARRARRRGAEGQSASRQRSALQAYVSRRLLQARPPTRSAQNV